MLVLSRKKGEQVVIGDDITVTVVKIHENKVKLGIEAPSGMSVHRHEVWVAIQQEGRSGRRNERATAPADRLGAQQVEGGQEVSP